MTLQNAPPGLDYERDKRFSKVCKLVRSFKYPPICIVFFIFCYFWSFLYISLSPFLFISSFCTKNLWKKNWFQSFKEMVATCLVKDPKKRPSSEKLLKHPFFKHARSVDYLTRTILDGLDPLGDRFKKLKVPSLSQAFLLLALFVLWKLWIVCSTRLVCHMFTGKRGWSSGTKQGFVWGQGAFITGANYKNSLSDPCMC